MKTVLLKTITNMPAVLKSPQKYALRPGAGSGTHARLSALCLPCFPTDEDKDHQNANCSWNSVLSYIEPRPYLAMGKGPHHKNNRVAAGDQLSHITDDRDGKRSTNFHTSNWEVI